MMKVHEFTIIASGFHPEVDDVTNIFFEAGCDDATIAFQKGVLILGFGREAVSFSAAVISAFSDVLKTGAKVERFEPDHLVSLADIAKRTGLTRSAITNYHKGDRGSDFPTPVARVTSDSPLWDWCEVATWLYGRDQLGLEAVIEARIVKEANGVIESYSKETDHLIERMTARILELEPS
jgi:predicted DNA-binding transcriptional regulator AlpA